jgi:two-component system sensor histidine kinase PilS (NtrC family)
MRLIVMADPTAAPSTAMPILTTDDKRYRQEQRGLLILIVYRVMLAALLLLVLYGNFKLNITAPTDRALFVYTIFGYLGMVSLSGLTFFRQWVSPANQALAMFLVDCIAIPLMIHTGGGITSALGILLSSSIALTSLLVRGRLVLFLAAIATFGIFSGEIYQSGLQNIDTKGFTLAGLLGSVYFAIALLAVVLSRRVRESESLAQQRADDLAELARLNEQIIEQMDTGVVVSSHDGNIRYFNQAARLLLGISGECPKSLLLAHRQLEQLRSNWLQDSDFADQQSLETEQRQLRAHFRRSGVGNSCTLIFLEDASEAMKQARQIKLASLGRLTAGIAHQIRNPLSSINHAGQLLAESTTIDPADHRLTEIIRSNALRVNAIIESILQLSRRQEPRWEWIVLQPWLERFIHTFAKQHDHPAKQITLIPTTGSPQLQVRVDSMQLEQILGNLCENALRHSGRGAETCLTLGLQEDTGRYRLRLCDNGRGLPAENAEKLFEPFFTTGSDGTGLGLYIARELCEANGISLAPVPSDTGACFLLTFRQGELDDQPSDPDQTLTS